MSNWRHAIRTLSKDRGATAVVVVTIAVAIAATTVIYSVIDLVWGFIPIVKRDGIVYVASTDQRVIQAEGGSQSEAPSLALGCLGPSCWRPKMLCTAHI